MLADDTMIIFQTLYQSSRGINIFKSTQDLSDFCFTNRTNNFVAMGHKSIRGLNATVAHEKIM